MIEPIVMLQSELRPLEDAVRTIEATSAGA